MDKLYLVEIFIENLGIITEDERKYAPIKFKLIISFGPSMQFIIREGQLAPSDQSGDSVQTHTMKDGTEKKKFVRIIDVGVSHLFITSADAMLLLLKNHPLEIEVWNDDTTDTADEPILVGVGNKPWDTGFYYMLKETKEGCEVHGHISLKDTMVLKPECCCSILGDVNYIVRISCVGESVVTDFQQLMNDPDKFTFRTNRAPSMYECHRVEANDAIDGVYAVTIKDNPELEDDFNKHIEVCTDLQSCTVGQKGLDNKCEHPLLQKPARKVDKIRMGDISGPCGNPNCPLSHNIKNYIRRMGAYKKDLADTYNKPASTVKSTKKICGACDCKEDRWHHEDPVKLTEHPICAECGGIGQSGQTCADKAQRAFGTGLTPRPSNLDMTQPPGSKGKREPQVNYVISQSRVPKYVKSVYGKDYTIGSMFSTIHQTPGSTSETQETGAYTWSRSPYNNSSTANEYLVRASASAPDFIYDNVFRGSSFGATETLVYNAEARDSRRQNLTVYQCTEIPETTDCKCSPLKPAAPCKTTDCDCIAKTFDIANRKKHKSYCPSYTHKENCPVTLLNEDEEQKEAEDEPETEPLPYGLPPIKLGPCPVLGRPCSVPDGFARMYRIAAQPPQPPSYSDAGKVCCSKEFERIKKAIKEYMKYEKEHEYKCINKYNVDTERKCCDRDQLLFSLTGKSCCGSHKLAIQEEDKKDSKK